MQRFSMVRKLGEGGFGAAWLVENKSTRKQYVAKFVNTLSLSAAEKREALKEATLLSKLSHPNIVSYVESFENDGKLVIVMEFADGGDLFRRVQDKKK